MSGLKFLLVCILIKILLSADCLLERFPSELHFSDKLNSPISIDDYVISQYPSYTSDLTPPLTLQRQYSIVNHSKHFVLSVPYPYYVVPVFEQNNVLFEIYDIQTQQLINRTIEYELQEPQKCKFMFIIIYPFSNSNIFAHCTNKTHHRDFMLNRVSANDGYIQEIQIYQAFYLDQKQQIFVERKFGYYPELIRLYFFRKQICHFDVYSYQFDYRFEMTCQVIQEYFQLKNLRIIDFHVQFNISTLYIESSGKLLISYQDKYSYFYYSYFYSYWFIEGDALLRVISLCQTSIVAVASSNYLYFISIDVLTNHRTEVVIKQIARMKLGFNFDPLKMKLGTVGKYVIISNGEDWRIYFLSNNRIKVMISKCQIDLSLIYCDEMLCSSNSFYFQNKKYSIQKMKLINNGTASNRNVTLTVSNCNKVIAIKRQNDRQIQEVNAKQSLICRDNEVLINHQLCSGHNLTQRLVVNSRQYMLAFKKDHFNVEGEVVDYLFKSNIHIVLTNTSNRNMKLYVFYQNQSESKSFSLSSQIKRRIFTTTADYSKSDVIILLFFLGQSYINLLYFQVNLQLYTNKLIVKILLQQQSPNEQYTFALQQTQLLSFTSEILIDKIKTQEGLDVITNKLTIKLELIGRSAIQFQNNITHVSNYWKGYSNGLSSLYLIDLFTDYDKYCYIMDNFVIMYKQETNLIKMMLVKDIKWFYQILKKEDVQIKSPFKTQCINGQLAIFSYDSVNIIDQNLQTSLKLELPESTINDVITNNMLIHQGTNHIQVYDLKSGFMIRRIYSMNINQIVVSSASLGILLKNGTSLSLEYQNIVLPSSSDTFAELVCINEFNSILKIKKIIGSQTLKLPSEKLLSLPSSKLIDNFWNGTVDNIEISNMDYRNLKRNNENKQAISHIHEFFAFGFNYGYYLGFYVYDVYVIAGCNHNNYNLINCSIIPFDKDDGYKFTFNKTLVSISSLYNQNSFIMIYQNQTHMELVKYIMNSITHKLSNQTITCPTSTYLIEVLQHLLHPNNRWTYVDGTYLYLYRQNQEDWKSRTHHLENRQRIYLLYPSAIREKNKQYAKIQVYGLNGQCLIDEITPQIFGIYNKLTDFTMFIRNNQTYLAILCQTEIILIKYAYPHKQLTFYKADLGTEYIKIEANLNHLVLISKSYDHSLYKIYWETFPFGGTLELAKTYIQSSLQEIKGAALSDSTLITYSTQNIYVYHLNSTTSKAYSSERKNAKTFPADEKKCKDVEEIEYVKYIEGNQFLISMKGKNCSNQCYFNVTSSIDLKESDKIILSNRKYSQEYEIEYAQLRS